MSDRKETPDLLGDILNARVTTPAPTQPAAAPAGEPIAQPVTKAKAKPRKTTAARAASSAGTKWEYREVIFREFRGWRPRVVDGEALDDWKDQPVILDYLKAAGADGWEMVGIMENRRNTRSVYFKRPAA